MSSVAIARPSVQQAGAFEVNPIARQRAAAVWASLAAVAGKEGKRDDLIDGSKAIVNAKITGTVDGFEFAPITVNSILSVGHETERASSSLPQPSQLLAIVFAKLNAKTRESVIREVSEEFAASGEYPAVDDAIGVQVEEFLSSMRQSKRQVTRGAVKVQHVASVETEREASA